MVQGVAALVSIFQDGPECVRFSRGAFVARCIEGRFEGEGILAGDVDAVLVDDGRPVGNVPGIVRRNFEHVQVGLCPSKVDLSAVYGFNNRFADKGHRSFCYVCVCVLYANA